MILNHLWGLYAHPKEEWHSIDDRHETYFYSLSHIALISLIPALMTYYSTAYLGWSIGVGDTIKLTKESAAIMSVGTYLGLVVGVLDPPFLRLGGLSVRAPVFRVIEATGRYGGWFSHLWLGCS